MKYEITDGPLMRWRGEAYEVGDPIELSDEDYSQLSGRWALEPMESNTAEQLLEEDHYQSMVAYAFKHGEPESRDREAIRAVLEELSHAD